MDVQLATDYTHTDWIYVLLRNPVQYEDEKKKASVLSIMILTNSHPIVAIVRRRALACLLGPDSCLVLALTRLIMTAELIYIFLQLPPDKSRPAQ